uniref:Uncharacterized protein n=1 Tax=Cacopsylla melanoneura TaxID=428564 RepID=A0A8D9FBC2_9HEMI
MENIEKPTEKPTEETSGQANDAPSAGEADDAPRDDAPSEKSKLFKRVSTSERVPEVPEDYDPFDPELRMKASGSITVFDAFVHLMKGSLGTGILAMSQG